MFSLSAKLLAVQAAAFTAVVGGVVAGQDNPDFPSPLPAPEIDSIAVSGNRLTRRELILREMVLKPGLTADPQVMESDRLHLWSLGLFNRVEMELDTTGDLTVLRVRVSESFYLYPWFTVDYDPERPQRQTYVAGLSHHNLGGFGARLGVSTWFGAMRGMSLFHADPWFSLGGKVGIDAWVTYTEGELQDDHGSAQEQIRKAAGVTVRNRLTLRSWLSLGLSYLDVTASDPDYTLTPGERDRVASLQVSYQRDLRDYQYYPTSGEMAVVSAGFSQFVDAADNYFRQFAEYRRYVPWGKQIVAWRVVAAAAQHRLPPYGRLAVTRGVVRAGDLPFADYGAIAAANLELRWNLLKMRYYSFPWVPVVSPYLMNLKFSLEGVVFIDAGAVLDPDQVFFGYWPRRGWGNLPGVRSGLLAAGLGVQSQVPFLETVHLLVGWAPRQVWSRPSLVAGVGVTF